MTKTLVLATALLGQLVVPQEGYVFLPHESHVTTPIGQSPDEVMHPKRWLDVDCAPSEAASDHGCLYTLPPSRVVFYVAYPAGLPVCLAEVPDGPARCVQFGEFKAWLLTATGGK